jgi:hypothetical protein
MSSLSRSSYWKQMLVVWTSSRDSFNNLMVLVMQLIISDKTKLAVQTALCEEYFEGAVEAVFAEHPESTRDDVVDTVDAIDGGNSRTAEGYRMTLTVLCVTLRDWTRAVTLHPDRAGRSGSSRNRGGHVAGISDRSICGATCRR